MESQLSYMDVAKYLYRNVKDMNNLKLQKMMFFAYIEYYEKYKKELFKDDFEAWVYGPVLPDLYYSFYKLLMSEDKENINDKNVETLLNQVISKYGSKTAFDLVDETHKHPAWINARKGLKDSQPSNNKINLKSYLDKIEK